MAPTTARPTRRIALAVGVGILLTCLLAACTPAARIYAKQDGDDVVFRICETFRANQIAVFFAADSASDLTVWQVDGPDLAISEGSEYRAGQLLPEFTTTVPFTMSVDDLKDGAFGIAFNLIDAEGTISRNRVSSFDGSKLSENAWIDSNGVTVSPPC